MEAGVVAERSRLDKVKIENENLLLQEKLNTEHEARLVIEKRIAQRGLTGNELISISLSTAGLGGQPINIVFQKDDPETRLLATNLIIALPDRKWKPKLFEGLGWWMHQVDVAYDPSDKDAEQHLYSMH